MEIPVNVYWKKVSKNLWINVAGSSRGSSRVTQTQRVLGKTKLFQGINLTTLYNKDFFEFPAMQVRAMLQRNRLGFTLPPLSGSVS